MNEKLYESMDWREVEGIVYSDVSNPGEILGIHKRGRQVIAQTFFPGAKKVTLQNCQSGKKTTMEMVDEYGFFAAILSGKGDSPYEYFVEMESGEKYQLLDPYSLSVAIPGGFCKSFQGGSSLDAYRYLGAHVKKGKQTEFVLWAPQASAVVLVPHKKPWEKWNFLMNRTEEGFFTLTIPEDLTGVAYHYQIKCGAEYIQKRDPYAYVVGENGESIVGDPFGITNAEGAIKTAKKEPFVYGDAFSVLEFKAQNADICIAKRVLADGFNAVAFSGIQEGRVNCKDDYLSGNFFASSLDYEEIKTLRTRVRQLKEIGIKVIIDWNPAGFSDDAEGMIRLDGTGLYEHEDGRQGHNYRRGACLFRYDSPQVQSFLFSSAAYWIRALDADGIRLNHLGAMLFHDYDKNPGEWIPNLYGENGNLEAIQFLKNWNSKWEKEFPGVVRIAKIDAQWPQVTGWATENHLGFDLKWNGDIEAELLHYLEQNVGYRSWHYHEVTDQLLYVYSDQQIIANGADSLQIENPDCRMTLSFLMTLPGKRWLVLPEIDHTEDQITYEKIIGDCNNLVIQHPSLHEMDGQENGFKWIRALDEQGGVLAYERSALSNRELCLVVANTATVDKNTRIGVRQPGKYTPVFHSELKEYGGNLINAGEVRASVPIPADDQLQSIEIELPSESLVVFQYQPFTPIELDQQELVRIDRDRNLLEEEVNKLQEEKAEMIRRHKEELADINARMDILLEQSRNLIEAEENCRQRLKK